MQVEKIIVTLQRKSSTMGKYEIPFINYVIRAFAVRFKMTRQAAYRYLLLHNGLSFLIEFYDVEHLQDVEETVDDLVFWCKKNGGQLA